MIVPEPAGAPAAIPGDPRPAPATRAAGGAAAWAVLARGRGRVLAVFRDCLYLQAGGSLCCVGGEGLVLGPLNLRLGDHARVAAACARIEAGAAWHCLDGELRIGAGPALPLHAPRLWRAPAAAAADPGALRRGLRACRAVTPAPGGADAGHLDRGLAAGTAIGMDTSPATAGRIRAVLRSGTRALQGWLRDALRAPRSHPAAVPQAVLALLGCGPGLTPSGDDRLAAALVTLHAFARPEPARALQRAIAPAAAARTGRISAAHLAAAGEGEAVEPVHALLEALRSGEPRACEHAARALLGHGHWSGADALAGIRIVARALAAAPPRPHAGGTVPRSSAATRSRICSR